jgi:hypothetical protein
MSISGLVKIAQERLPDRRREESEPQKGATRAAARFSN